MTYNPDRCSWYPFSDEPLLKGLYYVPKFCDPQFLMPEESPDNRWHLFVHSWIGIHHFVSDSGIAWEPAKMLEVRGHSPSIFQENGTYYLIYEKHDYIGEKKLKGTITGRFSRVEMKSSKDLVSWSRPRLILESENIPYASDYVKYSRVSRPHVIKVENKYRLYFGASHLILPDTKQKVSRYFGYAQSDDIAGPYTVGNYGKPIIEPIPDSLYSNLGTGGIRVIRCEDSFYAFQCGVYWNQKAGKTQSCLTLLKSGDGIKFVPCSERPIIIPSGNGWASSYIKGSDAHFRDSEKCWYIYFSANGLTKESVGLVLGKVTG